MLTSERIQLFALDTAGVSIGTSPHFHQRTGNVYCTIVQSLECVVVIFLLFVFLNHHLDILHHIHSYVTGQDG
jgi:hypothetical protein